MSEQKPKLEMEVLVTDIKKAFTSGKAQKEKVVYETDGGKFNIMADKNRAGIKVGEKYVFIYTVLDITLPDGKEVKSKWLEDFKRTDEQKGVVPQQPAKTNVVSLPMPQPQGAKVDMLQMNIVYGQAYNLAFAHANCGDVVDSKVIVDTETLARKLFKSMLRERTKLIEYSIEAFNEKVEVESEVPF